MKNYLSLIVWQIIDLHPNVIELNLIRKSNRITQLSQLNNATFNREKFTDKTRPHVLNIDIEPFIRPVVFIFVGSFSTRCGSRGKTSSPPPGILANTSMEEPGSRMSRLFSVSDDPWIRNSRSARFVWQDDRNKISLSLSLYVSWARSVEINARW